MAQVAIVKSSDLSRENRWDAGFHIALSQLKTRVDELRDTYSADEAIAILDRVSFADKAPLRVLARTGSANAWSQSMLTSVVKEYPHLSLALVEVNLQSAIARVTEVIERNESYLDALLSIQSNAAE